MNSFWVLLAAAAVNLISSEEPHPPVALDAPATMNLEQIKEGLGRRGVDVHGLLIKLEATELVMHGATQRKFEMLKKGEDRLKALGDKQMNYPWMKCEMRIDGERRMAIHWTPQFGDPSGDTPEKVTRYAWDGVTGLSFTQKNHQGAVTTSVLNHAFENMLYEYLEIPASKFSYSRKDRFYLPRSLDEAPSARVLPRLEECDGAACHMVEIPGLDKIWVEVGRGFALRRRERQYPGGGPRQVTSARDYVEATPGFWLPRNLTREYYLPRTPSPTSESPVATTVTIAAKFDHATFRDADFTFEFPANTLVTDSRNDAVYTVPPKGTNPLDRALRQTKPSYREPWSMSTFALPLVLIGILGLALAIGIRLRWSR